MVKSTDVSKQDKVSKDLTLHHKHDSELVYLEDMYTKKIVKFQDIVDNPEKNDKCIGKTKSEEDKLLRLKTKYEALIFEIEMRADNQVTREWR